MLTRSDQPANPVASLRWEVAAASDHHLQEIWLHHGPIFLPLDRSVCIRALAQELDLLLSSGFGCAPCCGSHWLSAGTDQPLLEICLWDRAVRLAIPIDAIAPITVDCAEFQRATQHFIDQFRTATDWEDQLLREQGAVPRW